MTPALLPLPWTADTVPHAILDILRGCNIRCRDCYNLRPDRIRPLAEIETQLDALMRLRRLQSVSIVGGEITLHPELPEIVRRVRGRGLRAELFSNGVGLTDRLLAQLRQAGADVIFLHIEPQQRRPDLPWPSSAEHVRQLRSSLAQRVAAHGIEVGLTVTAYPNELSEVEQAVEFALATPEVCYLLVTWWRDVTRMPPLHGDLQAGLRAAAPATDFAPPREMRAAELCAWLRQRFGLAPFAYVGSNIDPHEPRWLSFLVGAVHARSGAWRESIRPTGFERAYLRLVRVITRRYPFYQRQRFLPTALHLLCNGLAAGTLRSRLGLLRRACARGARLRAKRLLFQWPATIGPDGRVVHCAFCPDAVLQSDRLVPLCISDLVQSPRSPATPPLAEIFP